MKRDRNLAIYLEEASKYPLLDRETEKGLAISIQNNYIRYKKEGIGVIISKDSLPSLYEAIREGIESRNKLIQSNLLLAVSIAKNYTNKGLSLDELIQEGNIGIIKAAEQFDPYHGEKFSTYATHWIKQTIRRAIKKRMYLIRIPENTYKYLSKFKKTLDYLKEKLKMLPTNKEIANEMGISEKSIQILYEALSALEKNRKIIRIDRIAEYEKRSLLEKIQDPHTPYLEERTNKENLIYLIGRAIKKERDRAILMARYELINKKNNNKPPTLEEIGIKYQLSRERIRQIEIECLKKLYREIKKQNKKPILK